MGVALKRLKKKKVANNIAFLPVRTEMLLYRTQGSGSVCLSILTSHPAPADSGRLTHSYPPSCGNSLCFSLFLLLVLGWHLHWDFFTSLDHALMVPFISIIPTSTTVYNLYLVNFFFCVSLAAPSRRGHFLYSESWDAIHGIVSA